MELCYNFKTAANKKVIDTNQSVEELGLKNNDIVIVQPQNIKLVALLVPSNKKVPLEVIVDWCIKSEFLTCDLR